MLDYTDEVYWRGAAESEEDIRAIVYRHQQAGFGRVYWRWFGTCLDNSLAIPEAAPRWTAADEEQYCKKENTKAGWMPYIDLSRRFDPLKVAIAYGKKIDCDVHAMVRFSNFNRVPYANFWHDHPEFRAQMLATEKDPKTGQPVPVKPHTRFPYARLELRLPRGPRLLCEVLSAARSDRHPGHHDRSLATPADRRLRTDRHRVVQEEVWQGHGNLEHLP